MIYIIQIQLNTHTNNKQQMHINWIQNLQRSEDLSNHMSCGYNLRYIYVTFVAQVKA